MDEQVSHIVMKPELNVVATLMFVTRELARLGNLG
jgi:hypothetical protein